MEKQKALALKNFVLEADELFQSIMGDRVLCSGLDFDSLRKRFSTDEFEKHYNEFENELRTNLLKYDNHNFIYAYLKSVFVDACRFVAGETTKAQEIIEKDFEIEFMLTLLHNTTEHLDNFNYFCGIEDTLYKPLYKYFEVLKDNKDIVQQLDESATQTSIRLSAEHKENFLSLLLDKIEEGVFEFESLEGEAAKNAIIHAFEEFLNEDLSVFKEQQAAIKQKLEQNKTELINHSNSSNKNYDTKTFENYLLHPQKEQLAHALRENILTEKSKAIRIMIEAMKTSNPPLLTLARGEGKAFYNAMKQFFGRDIGTYQSIFDCNFSHKNDATDVEAMQTRLHFIVGLLK